MNAFTLSLKVVCLSVFAGIVSAAPPSPQLSEFEAYLQSRKGNVPKDFVKLVQDVQLYFKNRKDVSISVVQVPDTRAPEREKTSFLYPRALAHTGNLSADGFLPEIFLGFNEELKQVQVISWNRHRQANDFMELDGFGGSKPVLKVQPVGEKNSCLTCHQGEGPILARFPWSEFGSSARSDIDSSTISNKIQSERLKHGLSPILKSPPSQDSVSFENPVVFNDSPFIYDALVRQSNRAIEAVKICKELCGSDLNCRKQVLLLALLSARQMVVTGSNSTLSVPSVFQESIFKSFKEHWPADGFGHPSSVLLDRDPLREAEKGGVVKYLATDDPSNAVSLRKELFSEGAATSELNFIATGTNRVVKEGVGFEGTLADPQKPRPIVTNFNLSDFGSSTISAFPIGHCLGLSPKEAQALLGLSDQDLQRFIESNAAGRLVSHWPPSSDKVIEALDDFGVNVYRSSKLQPTPVDVCPPSTTSSIPLDIEKSVPNSDGIQKAIHIKKSEVLNVLNRSCAQCHSGESATVVLPLDDVTELSRYTGDASKKAVPGKGIVLDRIRFDAKRQMPPANAKFPLSEKERSLLIQALENPGFVE